MNEPLALAKVSLYRGARRIATSPERALAGKSEFAARDTSWKGIIDQHRKAINELEDQINILRDRAKSSQKEIAELSGRLNDSAGFETYFVELAEAGDPGRRQELAAKYGVTYSSDWVAGLISRYNLKLLGE